MGKEGEYPVIIRHEAPSDRAAIRFVNEQAFGGTAEAEAIEALRARGAATLSLVAVIAGQVVGHLFFSPATIEGAGQSWPALGLAPLSVLPDYQRQGIGTALMNTGLEECRRLGHERVVVLGHPNYYPRFGFVTARPRGINNEYNAPEEAFMIMELRPGALTGVTGMARYQPEWNGV
ncbi:MAG TPA: N-acetyltransferase [Anaerolineae bacterium]|nr:N-acetyltransferase [Anaerolineae bacterium]